MPSDATSPGSSNGTDLVISSGVRRFTTVVTPCACSSRSARSVGCPVTNTSSPTRAARSRYSPVVSRMTGADTAPMGAGRVNCCATPARGAIAKVLEIKATITRRIIIRSPGGGLTRYAAIVLQCYYLAVGISEALQHQPLLAVGLLFLAGVV